MGFPKGLGALPMKEEDLMSLVGETVHLGSMACLIAAIMESPTAPWWGPKGYNADAKKQVFVAPPVETFQQQAKRRRKYG